MGGVLFLFFVRVGEVMGGLLSAQDHSRPANRRGNADCCVISGGLELRREREPEEVAPGRESVSLQEKTSIRK